MMVFFFLSSTEIARILESEYLGSYLTFKDEGGIRSIGENIEVEESRSAGWCVHEDVLNIDFLLGGF